VELVGRDAELAAIRGLLGAARRGQGAALVLHGEPGIGKSTLLDAAAESAEGMTVLRCAGVESETELAFAGLHQLVWPLLDQLDHLPEEQAAALRGAIGLGQPSGDRLLIAIALLTLFADVAERSPALVVVDDAGWLDTPSAEALTFVARRLTMEPIAILFAARTVAGPDFRAPGLPELTLGSLSDTAAARLLRGLEPELAAPARQRLLAESQGNPLALIELSGQLTPEQRRGRDHLPRQILLTSRLQEAYLERFRQLPDATRNLLLIVAADPIGDTAVVFAAARALEIGPDAMGPAEEMRLIVADDRRIRFAHPLVRSGIYGGASFGDRLAAHRTLAGVVVEEDQRAWHLAAATIGHDEEVAALLERSAERAEARSGSAAAAATLERAAALSPSDADRCRRLARAARAALDAGQPWRVHALLGEAELLERGPEVQADMALTRGLAQLRTSTVEMASTTLIRGAREVSAAAPEQAAVMLAAAARVARYGDDEARLDEVWRSILALPLPDDAPLKRLAMSLAGPTMTRHVDLPGGVFQASVEVSEQLPPSVWIWPAAGVANFAGELVEAERHYRRLAESLRSAGAVGQLTLAWTALALVELGLGRWTEAVLHASEAVRLREVGEVTSIGWAMVALSRIAGAQGRADECRELAAEGVRLGAAHGARNLLAAFSWCLAGLEISLGRYEEAYGHLEAAAQSDRWPDGRVWAPNTAVDLVDVCVRTGRIEIANRVVEAMERWADGHAPSWARVAAHRGRAALSSGDEAASHFEAAVSVPGGDSHAFEMAQTRLQYGEWLRRQRQKTEARRQLRIALEMFTDLRAQPWAERAQAELRASGVSVAGRSGGPIDQLTPQELQIARLCAQGLSNRDMGAQLFLSPRTVGFHLSNVFGKLGIASRGELRGMKLEESVSAV
jgi:DNA-binding CsgD family transcriptional regulator/tetratricopeptide (TPR) repeat protein